MDTKEMYKNLLEQLLLKNISKDEVISVIEEHLQMYKDEIDEYRLKVLTLKLDNIKIR